MLSNPKMGAQLLRGDRLCCVPLRIRCCDGAVPSGHLQGAPAPGLLCATGKKEGLQQQQRMSIPVLARVCSSLTAEVQNRNTCNDFHRGLLAFLGTGRKQKPPSPRSDVPGGRASCPQPCVQGEQEHPGRGFFSLCIKSLLPMGTSQGASAKALRRDTCSQQKMPPRVPQTKEVPVRGCVAWGGGGRAICHCLLINAGFDMIIKSDFCINFFC